ncbi:MAG: hypothetical protein GXO00_02500 [Candidatus Diapherotrites archaeon]|nr:hypothetical protein [Candidatus Diapherotrites archaeon]
MKFLLDENVPYSLYRFLKKQKYDVLRVQDIQCGLPDIELLKNQLFREPPQCVQPKHKSCGAADL